MRNTRGVGSVYRPKNRNASTGALQATAIWWIRYNHHGVQHRESSHSEVHAHAAALLKLRIGQAGIGKPVTFAVRRTTLDDLRDLVLADYRDNQFDTLARQEDAFNHLRAFFGGDCLADAIAGRLDEYKKWRQLQPDGRAAKRKVGQHRPARIGCAIATINRELASPAARVQARPRPRAQAGRRGADHQAE